MDNSELFLKTKSILSQILEQIDKYTLAFKQKDFFTFSDIEERSKIYKREYYEFIIEFNKLYTLLGQCMSEIVALFLEADRNGDEEKIALLNTIFENHLLLEKALLTFTLESEKELSDDCASVSALLDSANRLSLSIKALSTTLPS